VSPELLIRSVLALAGAFIIGSIPFAVAVSKLLYHLDIREFGSGNSGATNVFRVLGWKAGLTVGVLDVLKGTLAAGWAILLTYGRFSAGAEDWLVIAAAVAAMLGHSYSPFVGFRGGKGIATAAGALILIIPQAWLLLCILFVLVALISRMVSLASITVAVALPFVCLWLYPDRSPVIITSFVASALALWRHRTNIARILRGEEARISWREQGQRIRKGGDAQS
jgi:glycerol-3-phosphate acyltransferase PlsY